MCGQEGLGQFILHDKEVYTIMNDLEPCDYRMQQEHEEAEWHEVNRKLIDEIHEVVETRIKENKNVGS